MSQSPATASLAPVQLLSRPSRMRRLLPLLVACLFFSGLSWQFHIGPLSKGMVCGGQDFLASYVAGRLVAKGNASAMYDRRAISEAEAETMRTSEIEGDPRFLPWLNPPFAALPFAAFANADYRNAAFLWLATNCILAGIALALLGRMLPATTTTPRVILFWLVVVLSMPFLQAMFAQQNTLVSLVLICLLARCWIAGMGFRAGVCAGLMLFKPQLAMVIATVLGISMGAEAVVGFGVVAIGLLALTAWALPGTLTAYLHQLPPTIHWLQMELPYNWGRQTTLQGFWRLAIQGHAAGPTNLFARMLAWAGAAAIGIPLAIAAWRTRGVTAADRRRLIAAAIVATPMIAPYYMDYDLLLLAVAAALTIVEKPPQSGGLMVKTLVMAWLAVAIALYLNPFLAAEGRWNVAVIAIAAMAVLLIGNVFSHLPRLTAADRPFLSGPASALSR